MQAALFGAVLLLAGMPSSSSAQAPPTPAATADGAAPAAKGPEAPQKRLVIRFLTTDDFPPFNYYDDEGILTGLNVDLARAVCLEVGAACDIKVRPWEELMLAMKRGDADAVIAAQTVGGPTANDVDFSDRYFQTPGRFAGPANSEATEVNPGDLYGKRLGVAKGTTHEAFLRAFFRDSRIEAFENVELARDALQQGKVDFLFDDAISLSYWLKGTLARGCCEFKGGGFLEPKYFGDGLAIAVARNDPMLKAQVNDALKRIRRSGRFEEIVNRYFPLGLY
ncbi:MAG: transporter substrate-binding domain-containing protein [Hyphomicrobiaceae bacterium]|nr:transporter substrate-binding domain-containing protein [Hyphomicrobiaceae bacterium]